MINICKEITYEIKKSKFIAVYLQVDSIVAFNTYLHTLKDQHKKANHFCFAYKIFDQIQHVKAFDDGEPKGSAGHPIFQLLEKRQLNNVAVIVIRYFGGIKLGKGPLIRSYLKAAILALE